MTDSERKIANQEGVHSLGQIELDGKPYACLLNTYEERKQAEVYEKYQTGVPALTDLSILQHVGDVSPWVATGHSEYTPKTFLDANNCLLTSSGIQSIKNATSVASGAYIGLQGGSVVGSSYRPFVYNGREFIYSAGSWSDGEVTYTFGLNETLVLYSYPYLYFLIDGKVYVDLSLIKKTLNLKVVGGKLCLNEGEYPLAELPLDVYGTRLYRVNGLGYLEQTRDYLIQPETGKIALIEHSAGRPGEIYTISYLYEDIQWDSEEFNLETTYTLKDKQLRSLILYRKTGGYGNEVLVNGRDYLIDPNSYKMRLIPSGRHQPANYHVNYIKAKLTSKSVDYGPNLSDSFDLGTRGIKAILIKDRSLATQVLTAGQDYLIEPRTGKIRFIPNSMATMGKPYSVAYLYGTEKFGEWTGPYASEIELCHGNISSITVGRNVPSSGSVQDGSIEIDNETKNFRLKEYTYNSLGSTFDLDYIKNVEHVASKEVVVGEPTVLKVPDEGIIDSRTISVRWKNPSTLISLVRGTDYNFDPVQGAFYFNETKSLKKGDTIHLTAVKYHTLSEIHQIPGAIWPCIFVSYPVVDVMIYGLAPYITYTESGRTLGNREIEGDYRIDYENGRIFIPYGSRIVRAPYNHTVSVKYTFKAKRIYEGTESKDVKEDYSIPVTLQPGEFYLPGTLIVKGRIAGSWKTDEEAVFVIGENGECIIDGSLPSATSVKYKYSVVYDETYQEDVEVEYNTWIPLEYKEIFPGTVAVSQSTAGLDGRGLKLINGYDYHVNAERGLITFPTVDTRRNGCPDGIHICNYYLYGYKEEQNYVFTDKFYRPWGGVGASEPDFANAAHVQVEKAILSDQPGESIDAPFQYNSQTQEITINATSSVGGSLQNGDKVIVYFNYNVPELVHKTGISKSDSWVSMKDVEGEDYLAVNMATLVLRQPVIFSPYRAGIDYLLDSYNGVVYPIAGSSLANGTGDIIIKFTYLDYSMNSEIVNASEDWVTLAKEGLLSGGEVVEYPVSGEPASVYKASESYFKEGIDYLFDSESGIVQILKSGRILSTSLLTVKIIYSAFTLVTKELGLSYEWVNIFGDDESGSFLVGSEIVDANPTRYELLVEGADYRALLDVGQVEKIGSGSIYPTDLLYARYSKLALSSCEEEKQLTTDFSSLSHTSILPSSVRVSYVPGSGGHPNYGMICIPDRDYVLQPESGLLNLPQETRLQENDEVVAEYSVVDWEQKMKETGITEESIEDISVEADDLFLVAGRVYGIKDGLVYLLEGRKGSNLLNYGGTTVKGIGSIGPTVVVYGGINLLDGKTAGFIDTIQGERLVYIDDYKDGDTTVKAVSEGGGNYFVAGTYLCELLGNGEYRKIYDTRVASAGEVTDLRVVNKQTYFAVHDSIFEFNTGEDYLESWVLTGYLDAGYKNVVKLFGSIKLKLSRPVDTVNGEAVRIQCFSSYEQLLKAAQALVPWDPELAYDLTVSYDGIYVTGTIPDDLQSEGLYIRIVFTGLKDVIKLISYDLTYLPYGTYNRSWVLTIRCQQGTKLRDLRYDTRFPYEIFNDLKVLASQQRKVKFRDLLGKEYNVRIEDLSTQGMPPDQKTGERLVTLALNQIN